MANERLETVNISQLLNKQNNIKFKKNKHGASGLWLGTRTGAAGTATLVWSFLAPAYGSMNEKKN